jgi:hypothetical protein
MKQPQNKPEVANWCIVNALRLPSELRVSIVAKIMQHLTDNERIQVVLLSGDAGQGERLERLVCVHPYSDVHQSETECYCEKRGKDLSE